MNVKRWLWASLAVIVIFAVSDIVIHQVLLADLYKQTMAMWRPEAEFKNLAWLFYVGYLVFAPAFAFIYTRGHEKNKDGLGQGLRYGIVAGLLLTVLQNLSWYVVLPMPGVLAFSWFVAGMVQAILAGIAVGLIYKA